MSNYTLENRALEVFEQVVEMTANERDVWLKKQCGDDVELLNRINQLLRADASITQNFRTGHFLAEPAFHTHNQIGPYELCELIGEGGMGAVYRAERTDGAYKKTVAIKLLRTPGDGSLARFNVEQQAMANLEHANIAKLLDGGSFEGQPFIVMEYIEGEPFFYDPNVPLVDVLHAFLQVCDAVDYAHNNLVLHRDIKPSNILLTTDGSAKLLDFGVAKLSGALDSGDLTSSVGLPQTQAYTCPECLIGYSASVLSEVYSLGVLLREVATGTKPQSFDGLSGQEAKEEIFRQYPEVLAATQGDLDTIIAKAMDPDPKLRYPDVASLAADVNAFLSNRPITARPQNWAYLTLRFIQRHTAAVAIGALAIASLVGALTISINETAKATAQLHRANTIANFMNRIVNAPSNRYTGDFRIGPEASMREVLAVAGLELRKDMDISTDLKVELHSSISEALSLQLDDEGAVSEAREAWRLASSLPPANEARFVALHTMASVLDIDGRTEALVEARPVIAQAIDWLKTYAPQDKIRLSQMMGERGYNYTRSGDHEEAISAYTEGIRLWRDGEGADLHPILAVAFGLMGHSHLALAQNLKAETAFLKALQVIEKTPGHAIAEWPKTFEGLANILLADNRNDEAINILRRGLAMSERDTLRSPQIYRFVAGVSIVASQLGHKELAAKALARLTEAKDTVALNDARVPGNYAIALASVQFQMGNYTAAKQVLTESELHISHVDERNELFARLLGAELALVTKDNTEALSQGVQDDLSRAQELITALKFEASSLAQKVTTLSRTANQ